MIEAAMEGRDFGELGGMQSSFVSRPAFFTDCSASHPIQCGAYERRYGGRGRSANLRALRLRGPVKAFSNDSPFDELREFLCLSR
jgi:hypothetical protein